MRRSLDHPEVRLAVAEWLDRVAGPVGIAQGNGLSGDAYDLPEALVLARAISASPPPAAPTP